MSIEYLYKGVDLSVHNGSVDFKKIKSAGYKFVLLRIGYGRLTSQKDSRFEENYKKAKEAGLEIGGYWYSYANTPEEAKLEAKACLECLKEKKLSYPLYYDVEENSILSNVSKQNITAMVNNFCKIISDNGYIAGLYTFYSALYKFDLSNIKYEKWLAKWSSNMGNCSSDEWSMWQYAVTGNTRECTLSGLVPGCDNCSAVDLNYTFKDYTKISGISFSEKTVINEEPSKPVIQKPTNNGLKTGQEINLNKTPIYASAGSSRSNGSKTGKYYLYSSEIINNKVRVTNSKDNVGRTPIGVYVTGWVNVSDINKKENNINNQPITINKPSSTISKNITTGYKCNFKNVKIYVSSTTKSPSSVRSGTFYVYSSDIINNRVRVTNSKDNVGRTPIGVYVTGWVNVSDIE